MDPFLGQIMLFGGNFAPRGWAFCEGQLLPINSNQALFSILGTTYGGDGRTTFGLPDLRGRVAIHPGRGPGLSDKRLGQKGGAEEHTLRANEIPQHDHPAQFRLGQAMADSKDGNGKSLSVNTGYGTFTNQAPDSNKKLANGSVVVGPAGGNQAHNNMQPYLAVNYIIALQGIFPSRS